MTAEAACAMPAPSRAFLVGRVFLPFALGYFLSYMMRTVNAVISPDLTRELGLSAADLGLLTSTYFLSFGLAQIPVGIALDRYGPRRVEAGLLLLTALGAAVFASGTDLPTLASGRGLIGLGVSACLMGGLKAFTQWFPRERLASMTGFIMSSGALGAVTVSVPLHAVLPYIGWRGAFWAVAALAAVGAAVIFFRVPEQPAHASGGLQLALKGVIRVLKTPAFWRYAGQSAFFTGGFMALQGLWAVPYLMHANGYTRAHAADHLFWLNIGMLAGQLSIGALMARLARKGVTPLRLMQVGLFLTMVVEALIIGRIGPTLPLWAALGVTAATSAQMYGVVAGLFPLQLSGRATASINLLAFAGAFAVQWGLGGLFDSLRAGGFEAALAMQLAFGLLLVAQVLSFIPLLGARQGHGENRGASAEGRCLEREGQAGVMMFSLPKTGEEALMPDLFDNPMGLMGFEFVEFASPTPKVLEPLFEKMGFTLVARHRSKDAVLYRQGDINFIVNREPGSIASYFAAEHGPSACGLAFRVRDSHRAYKRALELGAQPIDIPTGPMELRLPAIKGIGGAPLYLIDRFEDGKSIYDIDFEFLPGVERHPQGHGFTHIDHLTHNVYRGRMAFWAGFYERLFNFREIRYFDIKGEYTGLTSRAMTAPDGLIRIPLNEEAGKGAGQIEEFLMKFNGEGIQHVALLTDDLIASVDALQMAGIPLMSAPNDIYYAMLEERLPGHGEPVPELQARGILLDGSTAGGEPRLLLQIFSETLLGPVFFEFIQRKHDEGFGEGNFKALFESLERDQLRRGALTAE